MKSTARFLFFLFYRTLVFPLLRLVFKVLSYNNPKIQAGLSMRRPQKGLVPWLAFPEKQRPIWLHCASGEFEYAKPVITRLKARWPQLPIMVTYFSPSFARAVKSFPGVDFACPLPWDSSSEMQRFLKWHTPRLLLIARTDTWPEMLRQTTRYQVPSLLFSATLSKNSGRNRGMGAWMSRLTLDDLTQIFCVSREDAEAFERIGLRDKTVVAGDTRFDQVIARLQNPKAIRDELFDSTYPCLIAGSTWEEDEQVLSTVAAHASIRNRVRIAIVPHEPTAEHLANLERLLTGKGLTWCLYSKASEWRRGDILIVDKVGLLAELYQKGTYAFVGGSFRKTVHSVMEPLAAGCLTYVGPHYRNNREAVEFSKLRIVGTQSGVQVVDDAESWIAHLENALRLPQVDLPKEIRKAVQERSGKSELVINWCAAQFDRILQKPL